MRALKIHTLVTSVHGGSSRPQRPESALLRHSMVGNVKGAARTDDRIRMSGGGWQQGGRRGAPLVTESAHEASVSRLERRLAALHNQAD